MADWPMAREGIDPHAPAELSFAIPCTDAETGMAAAVILYRNDQRTSLCVSREQMKEIIGLFERLLRYPYVTTRRG